jgi:hypothetical protein
MPENLNSPLQASAPAKERRARKSSSDLLLLLIVGVAYISVLFVQRSFIFDDSFISYRYSKNLAAGYGITWNRFEPPVEGYTNFLLVVALAPCIALGLDPLWVTRFLSVAASVGICPLLVWFARRYYGADKTVAWCAALAFLPFGQTFYLATVGLETVIYTYFLFLAFYFACRVLDAASHRDAAFKRDAVWFGFAQFLAFLLRPEALMLAVFVVLVFALSHRQQKQMVVRGLLTMSAAPRSATGCLPGMEAGLLRNDCAQSVLPQSFAW